LQGRIRKGAQFSREKEKRIPVQKGWRIKAQ
jgi:hypothetical protein